MIRKRNLHFTQPSCIDRRLDLCNFCINFCLHRCNLCVRIFVIHNQSCHIASRIRISAVAPHIKQLRIQINKTINNIPAICSCQSISRHIYGILHVLHGSHNRCVMRMVITAVCNRIACFQQTTLRQQSASVLMNNLCCLLQRLVQLCRNSSHSICQQHHEHKQIRE